MRNNILLLVISAAFAVPVHAEGVSSTQTDVIKKLMTNYAEKAKSDAAKAKGKPIAAEEFAADAGRKIYLSSRNWEGAEAPACAACHTDDPKKPGKHAATKKPIQPLAPAVNPERFTNIAKVEKNFSTHCQEIYSRDCDPSEKGHFLAYMLSIK
jgi:hypothetical protein